MNPPNVKIMLKTIPTSKAPCLIAVFDYKHCHTASSSGTSRKFSSDAVGAGDETCSVGGCFYEGQIGISFPHHPKSRCTERKP
ncbi:hypothetical protein [Pseudomonas sp. Irchel 3A5]|uniref:hypothetical protein n=1 Tax=Pseudomonas sp. Irchel 3A5 TaxID=2008911 RepID=UPI00114039DC|nr:hypothetical protein [Pseudomonas sp. Irchel 3A5]